MSKRRPQRTQPTADQAAEGRIVLMRNILEELGAAYFDLFDAVSSQSLENRTGGEHGTTVHAPLPVRVEVLDVIDLFERRISWLENLIRWAVFGLAPVARADRWRDRTTSGHAPDLRVEAALVWLSDALSTAYASPTLATTVEDVVWHVQGRVRRVLGQPERIYTLRTPCPSCGAYSVIARPAYGVAVCGNPACRTEAGAVRAWRLGDTPDSSTPKCGLDPPTSSTVSRQSVTHQEPR